MYFWKLRWRAAHLLISKPTQNVQKVVGWWDETVINLAPGLSYTRAGASHEWRSKFLRVRSREFPIECGGPKEMDEKKTVCSWWWSSWLLASIKYVHAHPIKSQWRASLPRNRLWSIRKWALIKLPSNPSSGHYRYDATCCLCPSIHQPWWRDLFNGRGRRRRFGTELWEKYNYLWRLVQLLLLIFWSQTSIPS